MKKISPSIIVYTVLLGVIVLLRLLIALFPAEQIAPQMVNLTDSLTIGVIWLVGWVGVYLAPSTGFAGMWLADVSHTRRFLLPFVVGFGIGLLTVGFDVLQPLSDESLIKFPASLVAYPLAGILEEIIFRLFLTTTLLWIISNVLLRGKWQEATFWGVSAFLGIFYTLSQINLYNELVATPDLLTLVRFIIVIAADFILAAYFYRKYGFLASLSYRMGDYLVWHILWGAIAKV
jgi:hypothetical protein